MRASAITQTCHVLTRSEVDIDIHTSERAGKSINCFNVKKEAVVNNDH